MKLLVEISAVEAGGVRGEFAAELHLLGRCLHLGGHIAEEEERPRGGDGQKLREVGGCRAAEVEAHGTGVLELERAALDPSSGRFVAAYFERLNRASLGALENGRQSGDIADATDLDELAAYLTTALIGVAASIRAEAPSKQVQAACRVATRTLAES